MAMVKETGILKKNLLKKPLVWILLGIMIFAIVSIAGMVYVNDYYRADTEAIATFAPDNPVSKQMLGDNTIVYIPEEIEAGLIFYPGGKVEYTAYEPLMEALASEGIMCILVEMPLNLAVLDVDAAKGIQEQYPDVERWYIGGHSLGGSMAATYIVEHLDAFDGIILLGSYSTADLSSTSLDVLSIYGSEDNVLNREKYAENISNLPEDFTEVVIDGGCHAYFGMYGSQDGDGTPTISNEEQIWLTVEAVDEFINP